MTAFVPPPPRQIVPSPVVPTYAKANDVRVKLWELGRKAHERALENVPRLTDQSVPKGAADEGLRRAREKARLLAIDQNRRHIEDENMLLLGNIREIVEKPSITSKLMEEALPPPKRKIQRHENHRRKVQRDIDFANKALVKRIMSVKSSMDFKGCEKDYARHRADVHRLKNVPDPCASDGKKDRTLKLPALDVAPPSASPPREAVHGRTGAATPLPPLQRKGHCQSAPDLGRQRGQLPKAAPRELNPLGAGQASLPGKLAWSLKDADSKSPATTIFRAKVDVGLVGARDRGLAKLQNGGSDLPPCKRSDADPRDNGSNAEKEHDPVDDAARDSATEGILLQAGEEIGDVEQKWKMASLQRSLSGGSRTFPGELLDAEDLELSAEAVSQEMPEEGELDLAASGRAVPAVAGMSLARSLSECSYDSPRSARTIDLSEGDMYYNVSTPLSVRTPSAQMVASILARAMNDGSHEE